MNHNVLLVEPDFPYPAKSKNRANEIHKNFVPIGLLKLGAYYEKKGCNVKLIRGKQDENNFSPDLILVTSLFTYWSKFVWDTIRYYRVLFPKANIYVGGIYSTLHYDKDYFKNLLKKYKVKCHVGLHKSADKLYPAYSLLGSKIDHHLTHTMRGCIRKCSFCGTWKLEPKRYDKTPDELIKELSTVGKNKVIFFDNNFLANKHIIQILKDLRGLRIKGRKMVYESQSGFDGRLLEKDPGFAEMLKKANFQNIRFAWDNGVSEHTSIKRQLNYLTSAGYNAKDISVFTIYNYNISYKDMLKKLDYCKKWGIQIADCRYRPLDSTDDRYNPQAKSGQDENSYYIHTQGGWTDNKVRDFRRRVRQHNIWIRYGRDKKVQYNKNLEKWSDIHNTFKFFKLGRPPKLEELNNSKWQKRIRLMNKVKNYYKKHNKYSLDFHLFTLKERDRKLEELTDDIESGHQLSLINE